MVPVIGPLNCVAVIVPAEKFPLASRATMALAVLALVAVVAELLTFSAVAIVASLESSIPAAAAISAAVTAPALMVTGIEMLPEPLKDVAVPVTSPEIAIVLAV
jgi:hypothetical protein